MITAQVVRMLICSYIFGIMIGLVIMIIPKFLRKPDGELVIDLSNPDKDLYQLRFETPLEKLPDRKKVIFKIKVERTMDIRTIEEEAERLLNELEDSQKLQRP